MAELRMTADAEAATPAAGAKRTVAASEKKGLAIQDLILVAVLLAAGAVLKLTVGSLLASFGMKPNFIIATYCLAIILIRPTIAQSLVIGLIAGLVCQIPMLNATPLLNIPSELLGALVCGLLIRVPMMRLFRMDGEPACEHLRLHLRVRLHLRGAVRLHQRRVRGRRLRRGHGGLRGHRAGHRHLQLHLRRGAGDAPEEGTEALNCWFGASKKGRHDRVQ